MNTFPIAPSNFVMQSEQALLAPTRRAVRIVRAGHLGMCFGVRDAIALALTESRRQPLTILGELVHNESVLSDLRARGIGIEAHASAVQTPAVMITAHGASEEALERARSHGLQVLEATCPLVHFAHRAVQQLVREGFHPVIVGQRGHVEVRGLTEDLAEFEVVLTEEDVRQMTERPRFGVAAQTTQPVDKVRRLVESIRRQFPRSEVRYVDTVCQPTKQRQAAALDLARESDVVVVVGGAHSNNTRELAATCRRYCARVHHVQSADDLRLDWFEGAGTVGLTAGTSTPDEIIDSVEEWLKTNLASWQNSGHG
ncbi:MAG TPA: 4-hydroxy-3-methylbut-2-enyl diphosphate reductase [Verrucomicrobiae bacterium]|nr:4-hydroxy-3-methylbut-2-enyl diphosphate reductase [Verrucomicrobiae bacterium]